MKVNILRVNNIKNVFIACYFTIYGHGKESTPFLRAIFIIYVPFYLI